MSKPRYDWWGHIQNVIRAYPSLKKEYDALHQQSVTANLSGMPGSGCVSRGTESVAIRELPRPKQIRYEAVKSAIEATERLKNGKERLNMVKAAYWSNKKVTLAGAAYEINVSYDTAVNYHRDFVMLVAYFKGEIDYEELSKFQKFTLKSQKNVL